MKTSIILPIHSFVDLITNSSSEVFMTATEKTVKTVKSLVDNILQAGGSTLKADDLFEFATIAEGYDDESGNEVSLDISTKKGREFWEKNMNDEYAPKLSVKVTVKNKENKDAVLAAKVLSSLDSLFSVEERYN